MLSMTTVRGNGPNFTFLTISLLVQPLSASFPCVQHIHSLLVKGCDYGRFPLWDTPSWTPPQLCLSQGHHCQLERSTAQHGQRGDCRTIPVLLPLYTVTMLNVSDLQHSPSQHHPTITSGFPMDCIREPNSLCPEGCLDSN